MQMQDDIHKLKKMMDSVFEKMYAVCSICADIQLHCSVVVVTVTNSQLQSLTTERATRPTAHTTPRTPTVGARAHAWSFVCTYCSV